MISLLMMCSIKVISVGTSLFFLQRLLSLRSCQSQGKRQLIGSLCIMLAADSWVDTAVIFKLLFKFVGSPFDTVGAKLILLSIRLGWIAAIASQLALAFFLERLITQNMRLTLRHYLVLAGSLICTLMILYLACAHFHVTRTPPDSLNMLIFILHRKFVIMIAVSTAIAVYRHLQRIVLPVIVRQQVMTLLLYFVLPQIILASVILHPFIAAQLKSGNTIASLIVIGCDASYFATFLFCARRLFKLRFLNLMPRVQGDMRPKFIKDFTVVLRQLSNVIKLAELHRITGGFFAHAFSVPSHYVSLIIYQRSSPDAIDPTAAAIDKILCSDDPDAEDAQIRTDYGRIIVRDEVVFDYFYDQKPHQKRLIDLLDTLKADILLPLYERQLYERQLLMGYVTVQQDARPKQLYSTIEQDEMCAFAAHLGTIINLLQSRNLIALAQREKGLTDELFRKQQEINHFKESVGELLTNGDRAIGVMLVKGRTLTLINDHARAMLEAAPESSPESKKPVPAASANLSRSPRGDQLRRLAQDARTYRMERSTTLIGAKEQALVCTALPLGGGSATIILMTHENAVDRFSIPFQLLKDVSTWQYSLYLETTKSGRLIHKLIPGQGEALVNFKIDLLKIALGKQAVLLENLSEEDLSSFVELIHTISLREQLLRLSPSQDELSDRAYAMALFGIEPLLTSSEATQGLLDQGSRGEASKDRTVHIHHIERLGLETQNRLAGFLATGLYQPVGSTRSLSSSVRIICSSTVDLRTLVTEQRFSRDLFNVLHEQAVSFPSLKELPVGELKQLIASFARLPSSEQELTSVLQFTDKEAQTIITQAASSLTDFKQQVTTALIKKARKQNLDHFVHLDMAPDGLSEPVKEVIRRGRYALKDKNGMELLWNKFQNQARIAALLKVNRSTVSRRLRELKICL